jgi:hypothetical protein
MGGGNRACRDAGSSLSEVSGGPIDGDCYHGAEAHRTLWRVCFCVGFHGGTLSLRGGADHAFSSGAEPVTGLSALWETGAAIETGMRMRSWQLTGLDTGLLAHLKKIFQPEVQQIVVLHYRSPRISKRRFAVKSMARSAIFFAIAIAMNVTVILDRFAESFLQIQRVFKRAKFYIRRIVAAALAVMPSAAKRVVISRAIDWRSAYYAKSSVSAHVVALHAAVASEKIA